MKARAQGRMGTDVMTAVPWKSVLSGAPVAAAATRGLEHVVEWTNDAFVRAAGRAVVGKSARDAFPELRDPAPFEILDRIYQEGEPRALEEVAVRIDTGTGTLEPRYYTATIHPIKDEAGATIGLVTLGLDVTDAVRARLTAQSFLTGSSPGAQALFRPEGEGLAGVDGASGPSFDHARDLFLGMLGHDLRNPINAIVMGSATLLGEEGLTETQRAIARCLQRASNRARRMIDQLLDFTRIRLGTGIPIARRVMDLHLLLENLVEEAQTVHPDHAVTCETVGSGFGEWDPDRLSQAVINLVCNAIEHGAKDAPVDIRCEQRDDEVRIHVSNAGDPMPRELLGRLFDPYRPRRGVRKSNGLGLGLFITRQIALAHGGDIEVESSREAGTRFTLVLPRKGRKALKEAVPQKLPAKERKAPLA